MVILIGVSLPGGLHAKPMDDCDTSGAMHDGHSMSGLMMADHDICPMEGQHEADHGNTSAMHSEMHDFGFTCGCTVEQAPVETESQIFKKVKVPVIAFTAVLAELNQQEPESNNYSILTSGSYSPPPIFLANESFLI